MDDKELRDAIRSNPGKLMFLYKGHWVAIFLNEEGNNPHDPFGGNHKVITSPDRGDEIIFFLQPGLILPVIIGI